MLVIRKKNFENFIFVPIRENLLQNHHHIFAYFHFYHVSYEIWICIQISSLFWLLFGFFSFQEIVPLNAGNVLVIEDNEPAGRWLTLINKSLNKSHSVSSRRIRSAPSFSNSLFFQKPSLKKISKNFRTESKRRLKMCNCTPELELERKYNKEFCFPCQQSNNVTVSEDDFSSEEDEDGPSNLEMTGISTPSSTTQMKFSLVASKQMVGIFVTVWMRKELVQHVGHLRITSISRGIMGYLGNKVVLIYHWYNHAFSFTYIHLAMHSWLYVQQMHQILRNRNKKLSSEYHINQVIFLFVVWLQGCISVSMSFHRTSFCFVCSHLASGEKEGDELRRNLDVIEILKNTQFPKICRTPGSSVPEKILDHEWAYLNLLKDDWKVSVKFLFQ